MYICGEASVCIFATLHLQMCEKVFCRSAFLIQTEVITVMLNVTVSLMLSGPSKSL
jgi:hypothetical protein